MASASDSIAHLDDITECPICTEVYSDPRVLPCIHTFCLKCIEEWGKTRQPEQKLACPLCKKEFEVSDGRFAELPRNFFVEKLLEVRRLMNVLSRKGAVTCDVCSRLDESYAREEDNTRTRQQVASAHGDECDSKTKSEQKPDVSRVTDKGNAKLDDKNGKPGSRQTASCVENMAETKTKTGEQKDAAAAAGNDEQFSSDVTDGPTPKTEEVPAAEAAVDETKREKEKKSVKFSENNKTDKDQLPGHDGKEIKMADQDSKLEKGAVKVIVTVSEEVTTTTVSWEEEHDDEDNEEDQIEGASREFTHKDYTIDKQGTSATGSDVEDRTLEDRTNATGCKSVSDVDNDEWKNSKSEDKTEDFRSAAGVAMSNISDEQRELRELFDYIKLEIIEEDDEDAAVSATTPACGGAGGDGSRPDEEQIEVEEVIVPKVASLLYGKSKRATKSKDKGAVSPTRPDDDSGNSEKVIHPVRVAPRAMPEETDDLEERQPRLATVYCIDCRQSMCPSCSLCHRNIRLTSSHRIVDLGAQFQPDQLLRMFQESWCDVHADKMLEIYCFDCRLAVCMMCFIAAHGAHKCADIKQAGQETERQLRVDVDDVQAKTEECHEMLQEVSDDETAFNRKAVEIEKQILDRAEDMKNWIESYKVQLVDELNEAKKKQQRQLTAVRTDVAGRLLMIETFKKFSEQLLNRGTACDIARASSGLRDRAKELVQFDVRCDLDVVPTVIDVKFVSNSSSPDRQSLNSIFGELKVGDISGESKKLARVIPSNGFEVRGVTSLDDEVFVVRRGSKQIDVYDSLTLSLQRHLPLPATKPSGVACCPFHRCIYVSDEFSFSVFRVQLTPDDAVTNWSVGADPRGLAVNADHNVLVACRGANRIEEYTTLGGLVRQIALQSDMTYPLNVVELSRGLLGVTHGGSLHRFCVVDQSGTAVRSFGGPRGSGPAEMNTPYGLTVNKRGTVFVADNGNNRILVLDPTTLAVTQPPLGGNLNSPYCVHLDQARHRMYVGEYNTGRRVIALEKTKHLPF